MCGQRSGHHYLGRRKRLPVRHFLEDGTEPFQLIFNEEWHNLGELDLFFFLIGKAG